MVEPLVRIDRNTCESFVEVVEQQQCYCEADPDGCAAIESEESRRKRSLPRRLLGSRIHAATTEAAKQ